MLTSAPTPAIPPATKHTPFAALFPLLAILPALSIPLLTRQPREVMLAFYSLWLVGLSLAGAVFLKKRIARLTRYFLGGTALCAMALFVTSAYLAYKS